MKIANCYRRALRLIWADGAKRAAEGRPTNRPVENSNKSLQKALEFVIIVDNWAAALGSGAALPARGFSPFAGHIFSFIFLRRRKHEKESFGHGFGRHDGGGRRFPSWRGQPGGF
jgi:hypothetical protein